MKYGDRIEWTYRHFVNSKSSTMRTKRGTFEGLIKHTARHKGSQMAVVRFEGNKRQSKIPLIELRKAFPRTRSI